MTVIDTNRDTETRIFSAHGLRLHQFYACISRPSAKWDLESPDLHAVMPDHVAWARGLEKDGIMFIGGPFRAPDYAWDGSGMMLARAKSLADAERLASEDPLVIHGWREYEVRGWQLNEGRMQFTLDLDSNAILVA